MFLITHSLEDDDEIRCLKILRDKLLRECRLHPSRGRIIPNDRLLSILKDVRDSARSKATWDDAIRSASSDSNGPKEHSIDTLAAAFKVMVEEYLWESENKTAVQGNPTPAEPSRIPPPELFSDPLEDQLRAEIDHLRAKLTESECACSELMEKNKKCMRELAQVKDDYQRLEQKQQSSNSITKPEPVSPDPVLLSKLGQAETRVSELNSELEKMKTQLSISQSQELRFRSKLDSIEKIKISPNLSPDTLPTLLDWKFVYTKLAYLMSTKGVEPNQLSLIESLMSQIQTLETQKNDADAEVTRLSKILVSSSSPHVTKKLVLPPAPTSGISIHRQEAEDFVGSAIMTNNSSIRSSSSRKSSGSRKKQQFSSEKKKKSSQDYSVNNCIQQ